MKTFNSAHKFILVLLMTTGSTAMAQTGSSPKETPNSDMKTYVIEREIPGAGKFTPADLKSISQKSCGVLKELGPEIKWLHSYVTGNKIYCVYQAKNEEVVRKHAKMGGFPANSVSEVGTIISPETAN